MFFHVDRSGYTPWLSQQVRAKEDLNTFAKTAREKGLAVAIHTLGELMSKRGDTRSPYAYAYTKNLWEPGKPIIIPAEDRMIRDQLPRNTILDR